MVHGNVCVEEEEDTEDGQPAEVTPVAVGEDDARHDPTALIPAGGEGRRRGGEGSKRGLTGSCRGVTGGKGKTRAFSGEVTTRRMRGEEEPASGRLTGAEGVTQRSCPSKANNFTCDGGCGDSSSGMA